MKPVIRLTMTTVLLACAGSGFAAAGGVKDAVCIPVDGTVTSTVDPTCGINGAWPYAPPSPPGWLGCFVIEGKGKAKFKGYSGTTSVPVVNPGNPSVVTATPLLFPPTSLPDARSQVVVFTSNAALTGKLVTGRSGTLYTQDTGAITPVDPSAPIKTVGQILKIIGGTDDFDGATGTIAVAGDEVGGAAFYTGQVCVKAK